MVNLQFVSVVVLIGAPALVSCEAVNDFERPYPHNLTLQDVSFRYINLTWNPPEQNSPEQNSSQISAYVIYYQRKKLMGAGGCPQQGMKTSTINATGGAAAVNHTQPLLYVGIVKGLDPGTLYQVCVEAVYTDSEHRPYTHTIQRQTEGCGPPDTAERSCSCSSVGTNKDHPCKGDTCDCDCKDKFFTGEKCDSCVKGYYLHELMSMCEKCPCEEDRAIGSCYTDRGLIKCHCKPKYNGTTCSFCANGLYGPKLTGPCSPCKCHNNHHPDDPKMCDSYTGICTSCFYNTTGDYCERCMDGYYGDAMNRTCIKNETASSESSANDNSPHYHFHRLHAATVAGVCVSAVGLLIMLTTVCCIVRWKRLRSRRPFNLWTVELRDDHENVNFSQMMENDDGGGTGGGGGGGGDGDNEVQFFERERQPTGHRSSKSNIYRAVRT